MSQFALKCIYVPPKGFLQKTQEYPPKDTASYNDFMAYWWDDTLENNILTLIRKHIDLGKNRQLDQALYDDGIIRIETHEGIETFDFSVRFYASANIGLETMARIKDEIKTLSDDATIIDDFDSPAAAKIFEKLQMQAKSEQSSKVEGPKKSGCFAIVAAFCLLSGIAVAAINLIS